MSVHVLTQEYTYGTNSAHTGGEWLATSHVPSGTWRAPWVIGQGKPVELFSVDEVDGLIALLEKVKRAIQEPIRN